MPQAAQGAGFSLSPSGSNTFLWRPLIHLILGSGDPSA